MEGPILEGLTFDDVLLVPGKSSVLPTEVNTQTQLTRKISLNIPLVSAAMDEGTDGAFRTPSEYLVVTGRKA